MNIISTEELRKKEIINLCNGARLGYACDFEFDKCTSQIVSLIIEKGGGFLGLSSSDNLIIPWCKIECIGEDTILVKLNSQEMQGFCKKKKKGFFE
ncbi:MAG: YlmC/YmxH family sporulation protein [Clostridia bacterium]|nr:YlmC/YmxH family sporulation protein [Clostridia bacterium]